MKKFFALFVVAATLCSCGIIRIDMDTRDKDGSRIVMTSDSRLFGDVEIALGAKVMNKKDTVLAILATYDGRSDHGVFTVGDKMSFRLSDQSVITLTNIYDRQYEKSTETYTTNDRVSSYGYAYAYDPYMMGFYVTPYEMSSFVPRVHTSTTTKSYALYLITKKQVTDIIAKGIVKFRVEIENDELDMVSGTERVTAIIAEQYACLKEGLSKQHKRKDF